jgi:methyl-accepting chemotaxis protein
VGLLSGDHLTDVADLTEGLTRGLTEALSGMSVAFSTSLFGIVSAIVMTLLGVFLNVADRRAAVMTQIEAYIDNVLLGAARAQMVGGPAGAFSSDARIEQMVANFGQTVGRLEGVVQAFEGALTKFATSTRDFQEFNHHLKDNIQRMSLSFGDLSEALKREALRHRERV